MLMLSLLALPLAAAGCAKPMADGVAAPSPGVSISPPAPENLVRDGYHGRFQVTAYVLASEQHGPQLCRALAESLPPQCGGPEVVGWTWDGLQYESALQTKWGEYQLVGTYENEKFTLTEPPRPPVRETPPTGPAAFPTLCAPPAEGWKVVDPAKVSSDAMEAAIAVAQKSPDYAGLWIDEPAATADPTPHNDPSRLIVNVRFTKNLAEHEKEFRELFGGKLCVLPARHTEKELLAIQDQIVTTPGVTGSSPDPVTETVNVRLFLATEAQQRDFDARYGVGLIVLKGELKPLD
ncbi:MAG: hypothetical protein HOV71_15810 [Hamadaea sp.]|nr:hypothetical protein [Hamadaea sp.]NUR49596.1 hypothetical protein [Hamadaea sp.]NUT06427.1 hypothetical protein [Hamadaea sp.]